jgi:hypothetical protein
MARILSGPARRPASLVVAERLRQVTVSAAVDREFVSG